MPHWGAGPPEAFGDAGSCWRFQCGRREPASKGTGVLPYHEIVRKYIPTYESHWDPLTASAYLYSPVDQVWMSFDSTQSVRDKAIYANQHGLGGMMLWELSADASSIVLGPPRPPSSSLVATMRANLRS